MANANYSVNVNVSSRGADRASRDIQRIGTNAASSSRSVGLLSSSLSRFLTIGAGIAVVSRAFRGLAEQEQSLNQLRAALESTGGAAGRTFQQLTDRASELQNATTFSNEAIQTLQSQLLTFTSITGEAFDRTTQAALDLSIRMDQDLRSSVVQLGKALNDPVANLGALGRAGIQFSDQQTEVIRNLAETNRLAEAQSIILDELERQFGGSASAATRGLSGAVRQLGNTFDDVLRDIVNAGASADQTGQQMGLLERTVRGLDSALQALLPIIAEMGTALANLQNFLESTIDSVLGRIEQVSQAAQAFGSSFVANLNRVNNTLSDADERFADFNETVEIGGQTISRYQRELDVAAENALFRFQGATENLTETQIRHSDNLAALVGVQTEHAAAVQRSAEIQEFATQALERGNAEIEAEQQALESSTQAYEENTQAKEENVRESSQVSSSNSMVSQGFQQIAQSLGLLDGEFSQILGLFEGLNNVFSGFNEQQNTAIETSNELADSVTGVGEAAGQAGNGIQGFGSVFSSVFSGLSGVLGSFGDLLGSVLGGIGGGIGSIFGGIGGLFGGGGDSGAGLSGVNPGFAGFGFAKGGAFNKKGVQFFARGGVVDSPTPFLMSSGLGVAGEAGPEAILPLRRSSSGDLGVVATGGGNNRAQVNVNIIDQRRNDTGEIQVSQSDDGSNIDIIINSAVNNGLANGTFDSGFRQFFNLRRSPAII